MSRFKNRPHSRYIVTGILWLSAACLLVAATGCGNNAKPARSDNTTGSDTKTTPPANTLVEDPTSKDTESSDKGSSDKSNAEDPSVDGQVEQAGPEQRKMRGDPAANAALWEASALGHLADVKAALEKGANVHARNENGWTALMLAAYDNREAVAKLLIEQGAEVNAQSPNGHTPLMLAASLDAPGTVQLLLINGALVNVRDNGEKFTALMFAAAEGNTAVVKLLLTHNADKTLVDIDGDTAADFARQKGHMKIVELLK